jgi:transposase/transposase IS116/IS110/IS902 family protein
VDQPEFDILVGIDWGQSTHHVCVIDRSGKVLRECAVEHAAAELHALADWLIEQAAGLPGRIGVGIEVPHGVIVETLLERGLIVCSINPKQLDRFRDRYTVAGAKDDRRDAHVMADSLRTDWRAFSRIQLAEAELIALREDSRLHDELRAQCVQAGNRLRDQLLRYYPQVLAVGDVDEAWLWELWKMAPTPAHVQGLQKGRVQTLLKRYRIRRISASDVLDKLRVPAFSVAAGVVEAASRHIEVLLAQLALLHGQLKQCDTRLEQAMARLVSCQSEPAPPHEPSDAKILLSLPGVGNLVGAAVLAEAGGPLKQCNRSMLRPRCGIAPVTKRSGKMLQVQMRYACNPRLRDACHYWGTSAVQYDARAAEHYHRLRARGCKHARAVRGVVDRLLDVLIAMLRDRTVYDPVRYAKAGAEKRAA